MREVTSLNYGGVRVTDIGYARFGCRRLSFATERNSNYSKRKHLNVLSRARWLVILYLK